MKYTHRILPWLLLLVVCAALVFYVNSTFVLAPFVLASFLMLLPRDMLKSPKMLIWMFFIVMSVMLIGFNLNARGFVVVSSQLQVLSPGELIYKINDAPAAPDVFSKNFTGTVKLETNKGLKFASVNGTLGVEAEPAAPSNIKFGLDLKGGVRAVLQPNISDNATIDQIISTLQTRINVYGLREAVFRHVYYEGKGFVEISIAGGSREEFRSLLENQGKFEAKITFVSRTAGGAGVVRLDKSYSFSVGNDSIEVDGRKVKEGESFVLSGVPLYLDTISSERVNITATVFESDDIKTVFFDPQRSRIELTDDGYRWSFAVQIGQEGAQRFAWATGNLDIVPGGYLSAPIVLYLDGNLVDSLSIASSLKGRAETEIQISGAADVMNEAVKERARLQSILRSGALPTSVSVVQLDTISPTLGSGFLKNALLAGAAAILGVVAVVSLRYRRVKIVLPMVAISLSEVLIILGVASLISWTIDLPAIAGIIAAVGTGIDSQIIIIDQALRGQSELATLKEKLRRAFFVVFGAGGTVIAAMIPLMIIGFGLLRGFAITTIIGVLVGILIARPAFGEIVKKIVKE